MSKVEGGGVRLTLPPSRLRVTIFSRRLLGLTMSRLVAPENVICEGDTPEVHLSFVSVPKVGFKVSLKVFFLTSFCFKLTRLTKLIFSLHHRTAIKSLGEERIDYFRTKNKKVSNLLLSQKSKTREQHVFTVPIYNLSDKNIS